MVSIEDVIARRQSHWLPVFIFVTRHRLSYVKYPPLQAPESYNLTGIMDQMKKAQSVSHAGEGPEANVITKRANTGSSANNCRPIPAHCEP